MLQLEAHQYHYRSPAVSSESTKIVNRTVCMIFTRNPEDCSSEWCNSHVSIVWLVPSILRIYYFIANISDNTRRNSRGELVLAIRSRFCEGEHYRSFGAHSSLNASCDALYYRSFLSFPNITILICRWSHQQRVRENSKVSGAVRIRVWSSITNSLCLLFRSWRDEAKYQCENFLSASPHIELRARIIRAKRGAFGVLGAQQWKMGCRCRAYLAVLSYPLKLLRGVLCSPNDLILLSKIFIK